MATETRVVDYSFARPAPSTIKRAGYRGVLRYLGGSASKQLTKAEAASLHAQGLAIGLVYESSADRARQGRNAGIADAKTARSKAAALGYPSGCPLFLAVDFDATPAQVASYFDGAKSVLGKRAGIYGGRKVMTVDVDWKWQTAAWSGGILSPEAHLFQRVHPEGKMPAGCDENVVCRPLPLWGPKGVVTLAPPGAAPAPKPAAKKAPAKKSTSRGKEIDATLSGLHDAREHLAKAEGTGPRAEKLEEARKQAGIFRRALKKIGFVK